MLSLPLFIAATALRHVPWLHDPVSAVTHLAGAVIFLLLGMRLLQRAAGDVRRCAFLGVYVFSCVLLMAMSGVYHMTVAGGTANEVMVRLDHGAIFVLIAGTFTPIHGLLFSGRMRWVPLLLIWGLALGGIVLKTAFIESVAEWFSLMLYLAMGWFGTVAGVILWRRHGFRFIKPLLYGGIAYSVGAILEFVRWPVLVPGVVHAHEVFHLAVLAGAAWHFAFIWRATDLARRWVPDQTDAHSPSGAPHALSHP